MATTLLEELLEESQVTTSISSYLDREQMGDAELFACRFCDRVIFDHAAKSWFIWRGNYWERDRTGETFSLLSNRISREYWQAGLEAYKANDQEGEKKYTARAKALLKKRYVTDVLYLAEMQEGLKLSGDEWDANPLSLGVGNGVIDLTTGEHRPGQPTDYLRMHAPTDWLGLDQPAPRWEQFLQEAFDCETDLINFMQRLLGYCITGLTTEHRLPILFGEGRNGKGTLLETIAYVLGSDFTHATQADSLMDTKRDGAGAQPFVIALRGRRLVWASESKDGQRINAGLVKQLTGGDTITTRALYENVVTFKPSHKVMLMTNSKPHINAEDLAMWDRVLLIPFKNRFIDNPSKAGEYKQDKDLPEILKSEASGILAWLVRGCLQWQAEGLNPPAMVIAATDEYRGEEDTLGEFISDCLIVGDGKQAQSQDIYTRYVQWAKDSGIDPMNRIALGRKLTRRFGTPQRTARGNVYSGLGVLQ